METVSLKAQQLVLIDLFDQNQPHEDPALSFCFLPRDDRFMQRLMEKDAFTLSELHELIRSFIRIETVDGRRVFVTLTWAHEDAPPAYTFLVGSAYDDTLQVTPGMQVEYVPNIYVQLDLPYFTRGTVISGLNGETDNLQLCDIIVELADGTRTHWCMEEFLPLHGQ